MPFIPLELDAKKLVPKVARAAGLEDCRVAWGLWELWEWVYASQRDVVTGLMLVGFFGPSEQLVAAMVDFGFLEDLEQGRFRVRGATRLINAATSQSRAGNARAATARRDSKGRLMPAALESSAASAAGGALDDAGPSEPAAVQRKPSATPALTPITNHQSPIKEKGEKPPGFDETVKVLRPELEQTQVIRLPEAADLEQQIADAFQQVKGKHYRWGRGDVQALQKLLGDGESPGEIVRRLAIGLRRAAYPRVGTVAELERHWNHCASEEAKPGRPSLRANVTDAEFREAMAGVPTDENGDFVL
jgi:hypothetical protein